MHKRLLAFVSAVLLICLPTQLFAQSRHLFGAPTLFVPQNAALHFPGAMSLHLPIFAALTSADGTTSQTWQLQTGGPLLNNSAGALEARNPGNTAYAIMRGADPVAVHDLTPKEYADGHVGGSTLPAPPGSGTTVLTDTSGTLSWSTTASGFTAGLDLSGTSTSQTVVGFEGRPLSAAAPAAGNGYYWTGTAWAPSALNLAGGTAFITGILPAVNQASQTVGGDLSGTTAAASVNGIRGTSVPAPPGSGTTVLTDTTGTLSWAVPPSGFTAATDLSGTSSSQTVVGFQGRGVAATAPSAGNVYAWTGTVWAPGAVDLAGGGASISGVLPAANQASQTVAGDVTGTTAATTVTAIRNVNVPTPTAGYPHYNGTAIVWDTPGGGGGGFTAGQDLSGTSTSQTVVGLQNRAVAATAPTPGNGYYWNGTNWAPSALALGAGAGFVSGVLPAANQASQTLAGDVGGTTAASILATVNANVGTFGSAGLVPSITLNAKGLATAATTIPIVANLAGDVGGTTAASILATVNANVGTFGSASTIPILTVNGKGLTTTLTTATVAAPLASATGTLALTHIAPGTNGQVLTTTGGVAAWGTPAQLATLTYQPGGTPAINVFTTFSALVTAAAATTGPITVFFDCSFTGNTCTVPSGAYIFSNSRVDWLGSGQNTGGARPTVAFANGATVTGIDTMTDLNVTSNSSAPVFTYSGSVELRVNNTALTSNTSSPLIVLTGSAAFILDMRQVSGVGDGVHPVINSPSGTTFTMVLNDSTVISDGSITGNASTLLLIIGSSITISQPGLARINVTGLTQFVYDPSTFPLGSVFGSWAVLVDAANAVATGGASQNERAISIVFPVNSTIPSGAWNFNSVNTSFVGPSGGGVTTVTLANGATISGINRLDAVALVSSSTSPVFGNGTFLKLFNGASLDTNVGAAPMVESTGTGTVAVQLISGGGLGLSSGTRQVVATGAAGASASLLLLDNSGVSATSFGGPGTNSVFVSGTTVNHNQAGGPGQILPFPSGATTTVTFDTNAQNVGYDDTVVSSPSIGSNVQVALDTLKGFTANALPATGANGTVLTVVSGAPAWAAPASGGLSQLTGDVSAGPGSGSQVATVNSVSGTAPFTINPRFIQWNAGTTSPLLWQTDAVSGNGQTLSLAAQSAPGNGGNLSLAAGAAGFGNTAGSALLASGSGTTFAATPTGFTFSGSGSAHLTWNAGISGPTISQSVASGVGTNMLIQAQGGGASSNGGLLELLGGAGGSGGTAAGVLLATGDGSAEVAVSTQSVDLVAPNYRFGSFGGTLPTGTNGLAIKDTGSLPTAVVSGGSLLNSFGGGLVVTASSVLLDSFEAHPIFGQIGTASGTGSELDLVSQSGTTTGGLLRLRSGVGSTADGPIQLFTGNGTNAFTMFPSSSSTPQEEFQLGIGSGSIPVLFHPQAASGAGTDFFIRGQDGGSGGSQAGGNLWIAPGIGFSGAQGFVSIEDVHIGATNRLIVPPMNFASGIPTPVLAVEGVDNVVSAVNFVPTSEQTGNPGTQSGTSAKYVGECHALSVGPTASCSWILPSNAVGLYSAEVVTQCRVTSGGTGTVVGDVATGHTNLDWVEKTSGTTPSIVNSAVYGTTVNQTANLSVFIYAPSASTLGGKGVVTMTYAISTSNGLGIGTVDCTAWIQPFIN